MAYSADFLARYTITRCNEQGNPISNLKLQKILYFAWIDYCKEEGETLFRDEICAWQLGPVIPSVYFEFCVFGGKPIIREYDNSLSGHDESLIKSLVDKYGAISAGKLVEMSRRSGGAWDAIYKGGAGNRDTIPFKFIRRLECER